MQVPALGSSQAKQRAMAEQARAALAAQQAMEPEIVLARYAYVIAYSGGEVYLVNDLDHILDHEVRREPNMDEMYGALVHATYNTEDIESEPVQLTGKYEWAFLVVTTPDGRTLLYNKLDVPVSAEFNPTPDEVLMSAEIVLSDLLSSKTAMKAAQATVQGMMQLGGAMQAQVAEQQANEQALAQTGLAG